MIDAPERLSRCVQRYLGSETETYLTRISTGHFNASYFVDTPDNRYVLRVAPPADAVFLFYERNMMAQEPDLHALLRAKTSVPVPAVVAYDTTHDLLDHDYILMERLPGQPLSHSPSVDTDRVLFDVGQCLAQVHALTAEAYGYLGAHHPMPPQSSWPAAFFVMWEKLLCDIVQVGLYTAGERQMLLHLLDRHMSCFEHPVPAALLHMDVWGQNILVDADGRLTGLLDWDRALWGDPEIEFAVLDYCGISVPAFWEGYGRVRPQTQEAQIRRMFYLLYELQKYMVICEGRGHDTAGARGYKRQSLQLIEQLK